MQSLDLHAPILPGISAAGFTIGMSIKEVAGLETARIVEYYEGFELVHAINLNTGILRIQKFGEPHGESIYFGPNIVRLSFNKDNLLGCIYVYYGYKGSYNLSFIGSSLSRISVNERLIYDSGDEMYYRDDGLDDYLPGLAIVAAETDETDYSNTYIEGFCVHDWGFFKANA